MSKNKRTTAAKMAAELNSHLSWRPISTHSVWWELHKSNIHDRAGIAKPLITENKAKMWKIWCDYHKTWTSDDWKYVIWSDELSFTLFPTSGWVYVWRTPKESCNPTILNMKHGGGSVMIWAVISWYSASPIITLNAWITAMTTWTL